MTFNHIPTVIITALATLLIGMPLQATDDSAAADKAAVVAVVERLFDALKTQSPDEWRALLHTEGMSLSIRPNTETPGGAPVIQTLSNSDRLATLNGEPKPYLERFTEDPNVLISGDLANLWGAYDFWIDGTFSHCGIDNVSLVRENGAWKIFNLSWTVETAAEACPTASGPAPE